MAYFKTAFKYHWLRVIMFTKLDPWNAHMRREVNHGVVYRMSLIHFLEQIQLALVMDSIISVCLFNIQQPVCTFYWPFMFPRQFMSKWAGRNTGQTLQDCTSCYTVPHYGYINLNINIIVSGMSKLLSSNFINVFLYHCDLDSMSKHVIRNAKWLPVHTFSQICINAHTNTVGCGTGSVIYFLEIEIVASPCCYVWNLVQLSSQNILKKNVCA